MEKQTIYEWANIANDRTQSIYTVEPATYGSPYIESGQGITDDQFARYMAGEDLGFRIYYASPYLSYGDYDNSCHIERSNVRMFLKEHAGKPYVREHHGGHGWHAVWLDLRLDDEEVIEVLNGLASYPCIDDEDASKMETEIEDEYWGVTFKDDFAQAIRKKFKADDIDPDEDKLRELYHRMKEQTNEEFRVESGGIGYIDVDKLAEGVTEQEDWMRLEFYDTTEPLKCPACDDTDVHPTGEENEGGRMWRCNHCFHSFQTYYGTE